MSNEKYKSEFGGGAAGWEARGNFQVSLMEACGLKHFHTLLDVGCGPLRGGKHLIKFLDSGNYFGFDISQEYLDIAKSLEISKDYTIWQTNNFEIAKTAPAIFDFALCFSVLQFSQKERDAFFASIENKIKLLVVTHALWPDPKNFELVNQFEHDAFNSRHLGWLNESIYPVKIFKSK